MFTRIHHVAIVVRSLEQALPLYRDVLGLPVGAQAALADQGVQAVLLPMREGEVELLQPTDPAGGVARFLARRGEGLHHICVETPDVSAALAQARAAGRPLIDQTPRPGLAGRIAFLHPRASHGVLVEFAQPHGPSTPSATSEAGIRIAGIATVYAVVGDLEAAAATFARNFRGLAGAVEDSPQFGARQVVVSIGTSRLTLLGPADRASPVGCFLAERGEGLFGLCLGVKDLEAALRHLEASDVRIEVHPGGAATPLARLDSARTNGVHLFLCADAPEGPP